MRQLISKLTWLLGLALFVAACTGSDDGSRLNTEDIPMTIELSSPAFAEGEPIPIEHTCDGDDASPPLEWTNVPDGTQSLALIVDDPDAPGKTWVHWVIYAISPESVGLAAGIPAADTLETGATQGTNDFRRIGYGGPCPPRGKPHRYFFKLYALDTTLSLAPGATKTEVERAMEGHILGGGQLMGTYKRA